MKTNLFKSFCALAIFIASAAPGMAALSGTYTVGGSSPDYATLSDAINHLNTVGLSGNAIFHIRTGTYTSAGTIMSYPGNTTYSAVFQSESGNAADVVLNYPGSTAGMPLWFHSAKNVQVRNITIREDVPAIQIFLSSGILISGCDLFSGYSYTLISGGSSSIAVTGNKFYGSNQIYYYNNSGISHTLNSHQPHPSSVLNVGIYSFGDRDIDISENTISDQRLSAIYVTHSKNANIEKNTITSLNSPSDCRGVVVLGPRGDVRVASNNMKLASSFAAVGITYDAEYHWGDPGGLSTSSFENNMVSSRGAVFSGGMALGEYDSAYTSGREQVIHIVHNTFRAGGENPAFCYGLRLYRSNRYTPCEINVYNNVSLSVPDPASTGSGRYAMYLEDRFYFEPLTPINLNYNDYYRSDPGSPLIRNVNDYWPYFYSYATLSDWQVTGNDLNSISYLPIFVSSADLHTNDFSLQAGTPWPGVSTDIDGDTRSAVNPFMGADEATVSIYCGTNAEKILICHQPPGNGTPVTLCVSPSAVSAHLAHGCTIGPCPGGAKTGGTFGMDDGVLSVSPNPFSNEITLSYGSLHAENITVSIYSVTGQPVKTVEVSNVEDGAVNSTTVDTQDLPSGMYLAKFTYEGAEITKKIVKE